MPIPTLSDTHVLRVSGTPIGPDPITIDCRHPGWSEILGSLESDGNTGPMVVAPAAERIHCDNTTLVLDRPNVLAELVLTYMSDEFRDLGYRYDTLTLRTVEHPHFVAAWEATATADPDGPAPRAATCIFGIPTQAFAAIAFTVELDLAETDSVSTTDPVWLAFQLDSALFPGLRSVGMDIDEFESFVDDPPEHQGLWNVAAHRSAGLNESRVIYDALLEMLAERSIDVDDPRRFGPVLDVLEALHQDWDGPVDELIDTAIAALA